MIYNYHNKYNIKEKKAKKIVLPEKIYIKEELPEKISIKYNE